MMSPGTDQPPHAAAEDGVERFWLYKRGQLVLTFCSAPGPFMPTNGEPDDGDPLGLMKYCEFASGQFLSVEWEPRVRHVLRRADDLFDFIERLEDRRYEVDLQPPSQKARPFRWL